MFLCFLVQGSTPFKLTASTCASKSPKDLLNQTSSSSWKRQPKGPSGLQDFAANPFLKPPTGESWVSSPWSSALRVDICDIYFVVVDYGEFLFVLFQSCQVSFQCAWILCPNIRCIGDWWFCTSLGWHFHWHHAFGFQRWSLQVENRWVNGGISGCYPTTCALV